MLLEPTFHTDRLPDTAPPAPPRRAVHPRAVPAPAIVHARAPTDYGADTSRWPAALASTAIVAGLFSVLAWMNVAPPMSRAPHIVAVTLTVDPPRPTPRPKPQAQTAAAPQPTTTALAPAQPTVQTPVPAAAIVPPAPAPAAAPAPSAPVATPAAPPAPAPAAATAPADAGDLSSHMLSFTPPTYPLDARRAHEAGTVLLTLLLNPDGTVAHIDIAQSSGHPRLDQAALAAVRQWRWKPTLRDGQPTQVRGTVRIPFVLKP